MTLQETALRLQHDCPFNDLSKNNPSLVIASWCNNVNDVMEISADDPAVFDGLQKDIKSLEKALQSKVIRKWNSNHNVQIVVQNCGCDNVPTPVSPVFEKYNCLGAPTHHVQGGLGVLPTHLVQREGDEEALGGARVVLQGRDNLPPFDTFGSGQGDDAYLDRRALRRAYEEAGSGTGFRARERVLPSSKEDDLGGDGQQAQAPEDHVRGAPAEGRGEGPPLHRPVHQHDPA